MYLWNTRQLAKELKQSSVNERSQFEYFFLIVVLYGLAWFIEDLFTGGGSVNDQAIDNFWGDYLMVISIFFSLIFILPVYLCYRLNRSGDNRDFIVRYICLYVPIGFRAMALGFVLLPIPMLLLLAVAKMGSPANVKSAEFMAVFPSLISLLIGIWMIWRLCFWFGWIAKKEDGDFNRVEEPSQP